MTTFTHVVDTAGWATTTLTLGSGSAPSRVQMTVSYLSDALDDLLAAVHGLLEGAERAECAFLDEPGEHRWSLHRTGPEVDLTVRWWPDWQRESPEGPGRVVLHERLALLELARAVSEGTQAVVDELGEDGYLKRWVEHAFPTARLASVQQLLTRHPRSG